MQTLSKSLKIVEKQSMLIKSIQSEMKEVNKKLAKIDKNTTSIKSPAKNIPAKNIPSKTMPKKDDVKKKKSK